MAKGTWINVGGTWKQVKNVWENVGGVWKQKVIPKGNIGSTWKDFIAYEPTEIFNKVYDRILAMVVDDVGNIYISYDISVDTKVNASIDKYDKNGNKIWTYNDGVGTGSIDGLFIVKGKLVFYRNTTIYELSNDGITRNTLVMMWSGNVRRMCYSKELDKFFVVPSGTTPYSVYPIAYNSSTNTWTQQSAITTVDYYPTLLKYNPYDGILYIGQYNHMRGVKVTNNSIVGVATYLVGNAPPYADIEFSEQGTTLYVAYTVNTTGANRGGLDYYRIPNNPSSYSKPIARLQYTSVVGASSLKIRNGDLYTYDQYGIIRKYQDITQGTVWEVDFIDHVKDSSIAVSNDSILIIDNENNIHAATRIDDLVNSKNNIYKKIMNI